MPWFAREKDAPQPSKFAIALDSSELVLSTLADAARLTPVPYLQEAAGVALGIINMIQGVKSNKSSFHRLGNDACALVYIILCREDKAAVRVATVTPAYLDHARDLAETLHEIYNYTKRQASRNRLLRMLQYKSDAGTVQEYRDRLKHSLDLFSVKSSLSIQDALVSIQEQLTRMGDQAKELHRDEQQRHESVKTEAPEREFERLARVAEERENALKEKYAETEKLERERAEKERAGYALTEQARAERARDERSRLERVRLEAERSESARVRDEERMALHQKNSVPATTPDSNPFRQQNPFFQDQHSSSSSLQPNHPNLQPPLSGAHSPIPGSQSTSRGGNPTIPGLQFTPGIQSSPGLYSGIPGLHFANPGLDSAHGSYMSVGGDQNRYSNSVINTNSGNTSSHTVTDSNNDSSVRMYHGSGSSFFPVPLLLILCP
ncbi:hypothetical protein FPV67DRAFT_1444530 [Lyophyllum atratum]|nr:hypothetical protein FPV67DRAFT_1444530 [Lyophyllum atratum]